MRVKNAISDTGERFCVLLDSNGFPMVYPNLFITSMYRNSGQSVGTFRKTLENIAFLYELSSRLKIPIEARCAKQDFLSYEEVSRIGQYAGLTKSGALDSLTESKKVVPFRRVARKRLEVSRYTIVDDPEQDKVFWQTKYNRLSDFGNYIDWLERYHSPHKKTQTKRYFDELRPLKSQQKTYWEILEGYKFKSLDKQQRNVFLDRIRADFPDRVWRDEGVCYRNYTLAMLLYMLGVRIGEALNLKIEDIRQRGNKHFAYIRHNTDDKQDSRIYQPKLKTNSRALQLTARLKLILDTYITHHRSAIKGAAHCPFLFISHRLSKGKANPLSISAAEKVFREFSTVMGFKVRPHILRHTWNDRYSEAIDQKIANKETTQEKAEADRCQLMGWAKGSDMNLIYSARYDTERAMMVALAMQDSDFELKESITYDDDIPM